MRLRVPSRAGLKRHALAGAVVAYRWTARAAARRRLHAALKADAKVQLGCGDRHLEGWVNVDINRAVAPDVRLDLRAGLPAPAESLDYVFSEHVFEHLTLEVGRTVFADCHAALRPGGVLRIAMPDLRYIVERYLAGRFEGEGGPEAQQDARYRAIDSPALLLNYALRSWGHLYLYDLEELSLRLRQAGFAAVERRTYGASPHPELVGLEQRAESRLIVEATK